MHESGSQKGTIDDGFAAIEAVSAVAATLLRGATWRDCLAEVLEGIATAVGATHTYLLPLDGSRATMDEWAAYRPASQAAPTLSVEIPVTVGGDTWGVLGIETPTDSWRKRGRPSVRAFADLIGAAIERSGLQGATDHCHARYRAMVENLGEGVSFVDPEMRFTFANPAAERIVGVARGGLVGRSVWDFLPGDARPLIEQQTGMRRNNHGGRYECDIVRADGTRRSIEVTATPRFDNHGVFQGSLSVFRDTTDQREEQRRLERAKQQAERANRAKSGFLARMSHEIRTPISGVIGMADLLLETALTPEQQQCAEAIRSSADCLLTLINDILDLSKIEAGKIELESTRFDVVECLRHASELLAPRAIEKRLEWRFHADARERWVLGDPGRLRQIVLNLLGNAVKFTSDGSVELAVVQTGPASYEIAITDTGSGIPADELPRLFQPFAQADTPQRREGTGLGLAICRELAALMDGSISATSEPGEGSRFVLRVTLPAADPPVPEAKPAETTVGLERLLRVLVAEDNAVNQKVAARMLERLGCAVDIAANGREAVEMVERSRYDMVFMDCMMPEMDGYAATREIRRRKGAEIPIVALTAHAVKGASEECFEAGMNDYLTKPVTRARMEQALAEWCA